MTSPSERVRALDWNRVAEQLDLYGGANIGQLLNAAECRTLLRLYDTDVRFRKKIVMQQHNFGRGEYKYFQYPLPAPVSRLRTSLYAHLAPIANRWQAMGRRARPYPLTHHAYLRQCHLAGQHKPTPLLLRYAQGDYNRLHQDLYGDLWFPLQVAILLSDPERDFEGGEFVLTEQRPRSQSRAEVIPLSRGDAVAFAVNERPVAGTKSVFRVRVRHGVSRLRRGARTTLGIIFHDAR